MGEAGFAEPALAAADLLAAALATAADLLAAAFGAGAFGTAFGDAALEAPALGAPDLATAGRGWAPDLAGRGIDLPGLFDATAADLAGAEVFFEVTEALLVAALPEERDRTVVAGREEVFLTGLRTETPGAAREPAVRTEDDDTARALEVADEALGLTLDLDRAAVGLATLADADFAAGLPTDWVLACLALVRTLALATFATLSLFDGRSPKSRQNRRRA